MKTDDLIELLRQKGIEFRDRSNDVSQPTHVVLSRYNTDRRDEVGDPANGTLGLRTFFEERVRTGGEREANLRRIDEMVRKLDIDALAWYRSFHFGTDDWGIYIPTSSLEYLKTKLYPRHRKNLDKIRQDCFTALLAHEYHHFKMDYLVGCFEAFLGKTIWSANVQIRKEQGLPYLAIEEAAANASKLRKLGAFLAAKDYEKWENLVESGLPGYRDGARYVSDDQFSAVVRENAKTCLGVLAEKSEIELAYPLVDFFALYDSIGKGEATCPVHLIHDEQAVDTSPSVMDDWQVEKIHEIVETNHFKKRFRKLPGKIQKRWKKIRYDLRIGIAANLKFQKVKQLPGTWEIRVNPQVYRAFIRPISGTSWEATNIGKHSDLGTD